MPSLYEPYTNGSIPAVDEWTLSQNLRADTANGGINQLEEHYKTFIVSAFSFLLFYLNSSLGLISHSHVLL